MIMIYRVQVLIDSLEAGLVIETGFPSRADARLVSELLFCMAETISGLSSELTRHRIGAPGVMPNDTYQNTRVDKRK